MVRKLIFFFLVFVVTVWVMDFIASIVLNKLYLFNRYGMSGGSINYYFNIKPPEVLILGSSRAHQDIIPDSLSNSSFNLSHNGMSVSFQAALVDILLQKNALPKKTLVLHLEPDEVPADVNYLNKDIQYLKYYYDKNNFVRSEINQISTFEYLKYYFQCYKYNGTIFSLIKNSIDTKSKPPENINGFEAQKCMQSDSMLTVLSSKNASQPKIKQNAIAFINSNTPKNGLFYLNHIIDICRSNNVELVVFTSPYYTKVIGEDKYIEGLTNYLQQNEVPYFDYSHMDIPPLKNPWLWSNDAHLNEEGAKIFSHIFAEDFRKRALKRKL